MSDPIVTLREILALKPCAPHRAVLRKFIPAEGIPVNADTIAAADMAGLDVVWYAARVAGRRDVLQALASDPVLTVASEVVATLTALEGSHED